MAIEFKQFRLSIKKIDTLRDYVTFLQVLKPER